LTRANLVALLILSAAAGICGFAFGFGVAGSYALASVACAVTALATAALLRNRPPLGAAVAAEPGWLKATCAVAALVALLQLVRLAVFMVAPAAAGWSTVPDSVWEVRHSCFSSYYVAAENLGGRSVYDPTLYSAPDDDPAQLRRPARIGPFNVDVFEYPPPFLLLPRALLRLANTFDGLRTLWFGLSVAALIAVMMTVARSLPPPENNRAVLFIPLIWAGIATLNTLQKGNVQQVVIAAALLAMLLFERRAFAAGGLLLAFATMSKLYPATSSRIYPAFLAARRFPRFAIRPRPPSTAPSRASSSSSSCSACPAWASPRRRRSAGSTRSWSSRWS
jgi:alpha-1,2-mannosyltransferase